MWCNFHQLIATAFPFLQLYRFIPLFLQLLADFCNKKRKPGQIGLV
jgi:hypothetical protein